MTIRYYSPKLANIKSPVISMLPIIHANPIFVSQHFLEMWLVTQSCPTLCDPMDCSPPGSSVHRILQARILEWVVIPFFGDLPNQETEPGSPALQADSLPSEPLAALLLILHLMYNLHIHVFSLYFCTSFYCLDSFLSCTKVFHSDQVQFIYFFLLLLLLLVSYPGNHYQT